MISNAGLPFPETTFGSIVNTLIRKNPPTLIKKRTDNMSRSRPFEYVPDLIPKKIGEIPLYKIIATVTTKNKITKFKKISPIAHILYDLLDAGPLNLLQCKGFCFSGFRGIAPGKMQMGTI